MNWPIVQAGSNGEDVRSVQYLLKTHGANLTIDGVFGPQTDAAVQTFQANHGLPVDGIVGNETWPKLIVELSSGASGDAVRAVQSQIVSRVGGWLKINGVFDSDTDKDVRYFQGDIGFVVDGIVGPETWNALVSGYLTSQGAQAGVDFYNTWTQNDRATASKSGTPAAVDAIFARTWHPSDGWVFVGTEGAAGHFSCSWKRPDGEQLLLIGNDNAGEPFYFVETVKFQAGS